MLLFFFPVGRGPHSACWIGNASSRSSCSPFPYSCTPASRFSQQKGCVWARSCFQLLLAKDLLPRFLEAVSDLEYFIKFSGHATPPALGWGPEAEDDHQGTAAQSLLQAAAPRDKRCADHAKRLLVGPRSCILWPCAVLATQAAFRHWKNEHYRSAAALQLNMLVCFSFCWRRGNLHWCHKEEGVWYFFVSMSQRWHLNWQGARGEAGRLDSPALK